MNSKAPDGEDAVQSESQGETSHASAGDVSMGEGKLEHKPLPTEYDPMSRSDWSWFMVLAWIGWRNADDVRNCWDEYRSKCFTTDVPWPRTVKPTPRPWKQFPRMLPTPTFTYDGPMDARTLDIRSVVRASLLVTPIEDAKLQLKNALFEGRLVATGADGASGRPHQIEALDWAHLETDSKGQIYFRKAPGKVAYNDLRFMRKDVMTIWPPTIGQNQPVAVSKDKKATSKSAMKNAVSKLIKEKPGASSRDADDLAKSLGASRDEVRAELAAAREKIGKPVKLGRPRKE